MTPAILSRKIATLSSFGSAASGKYVAPDSFELLGDASTITADEYALDIFTGKVVQRITDDDGNAVDWSGYSAFTANYDVWSGSAWSSYSAESVTFAEDDTGYTPVGPVGELNLALGRNLHANYGVLRDGLAIGTSTRIVSTYADFFQAVSFSPAFVDLVGTPIDLGGVGNVSYVYVNTASVDFTVRGIFTPTKDGTVLILDNTTAKNMTIQNNGSPGGGYSKIITGTADESTTGKGIAMLIYNSFDTAWHLISIRG